LGIHYFFIQYVSDNKAHFIVYDTDSLGNSLMRDLLTDIKESSETQPGSKEPNILNSLSILEKELDKTTNENAKTTPLGLPPPGLGLAPPGLAPTSTGAMVVQHASDQQIMQTPSKPEIPGNDAWDKALSQFSALSLTEDFLKADSVRKESMQKNFSDEVEGEKMTAELVDRLFEGEDEEDYDIKENLTLTGNAASVKAMSSFFPGLAKEEHVDEVEKDKAFTHPPVAASPTQKIPPMQSREASTPIVNPALTPKQPSPLQHKEPVMPNMGMIPSPLPPHLMQAQGTLINPMHSPVAVPPSNIMPPMHMLHMNMPPHMTVPFPSRPSNMIPILPHGGHLPTPPLLHQQQEIRHINQISQKINTIPVNNDSRVPNQFDANDFPALGENRKESNGEEGKVKEAITPHINPPRPRISFQNPSTNAAPIPATAVECKLMTPRDLCHVLHSIMRPLSALDPYNADYYRWSYEDRKSRNLLFLGGVTPVGASLPNPVWKEMKVKAKEMDDNFRDNVEKRAADWSKEKHILGKNVKKDVKRPKALLATTTLSTALADKGKLNESLLENETKEEQHRANLWASRLASDKGYLAYLNLVELRRLLQSRGGGALGVSGERRNDLLIDVEKNVCKLNEAFGVDKVQDTIEINDKVLSRTLSLPKGRMLLSRTIDEGILPHPSACSILPSVITIILKSCLTANLSLAPPAGEDRLLRSLSGLVRTVQPSIDPQNIMKFLSNVNNIGSEIKGKDISLKNILSKKRTLMELLHAVLSRGGEVFVGELVKEWKAKEVVLLAMLHDK